MMNFATVLSHAKSIINSTRSYPKRRRTHKLHKQWIERAGLKPEPTPVPTYKHENGPREIPDADKISRGVRESPGLSAEANSRAANHKAAVYVMAEIDKEQLRLAILLVLLGASLVIFCLGFVLLIVHSFSL